MPSNFTIDASNNLTPFLDRLEASLTDRSRLNKRIADEGEELTRRYVGAQAARRHSTANRLGATPTGHLERAASSISSSHTADSAIIAFPRNTGLQRAFGAITIKPKNGSKYITIPVHPAAYGKVAREFADLQALRLGSRETLVLARKIRGQNILETLYVLVLEVTQKQDRTLLPGDQFYLETAERAAETFIELDL